MITFLIIIGIIIGISFLIWTLWFLETRIPKLEISDSSDEMLKMKAISEWLQLLSSKQKFNGVVLFIKNGNVKLEKAYGFSSSKKDERLSNQSIFRLASISKQFTAFGIMLLKKKHLLDYDDLVSKYIINFNHPKVTIRHLLNHTSGITVDYIRLAKKKKIQKGYILSNKDAVTLINSHINNNKSEPLQEFSYNNSNYILLARIIEIITKMSFEEYMKENVFIPLNMKQTRVWNLLSEKNNPDTKYITSGFEAYLNSKPTEIKPNWIDGVAGDGGVFSSIKDLVIWNSAWYENPLLTNTDLDEAYTTPLLNTGKVSNYGFGWVVEEDTVWHNGKWLAYSSFILRNTKDKTCFVLLDNSSNTRFDKIMNQILTAINTKSTISN